MTKRIFSTQALKISNVYKSPVMKKIMANPKMAKVLNTTKEKKELLSAIREHGGTKRDVREALGELYFGDDDSLSKREVSVIGKEIGGGALGRKRYVYERGKSDKEALFPGKIPVTVEEDKTNKDFSSTHDSSFTQDEMKNKPVDNKSVTVSRLSSMRKHTIQKKDSNEKSKNIWSVLNKINK